MPHAAAPVHAAQHRSRPPRWRRLLATIVAGVLVVATTAVAGPVLAQEGGIRLLHLPVRWCVMEGTAAARTDPDAAVLKRLRRGSSILAPEAGITMRSAFNRTLAGVDGFPVIADPRPTLGRRGDVLVPTISSSEYRLVVERCARAWKGLEAASAEGSGLGGVARGPVAVIIGDFVDAAGRPYPSVWGYAFSVSASGNLCAASDPRVRRANGGSMMVVDTTDGSPSQRLDRRLVAHEVGHILGLGHGDGFDNRGSVPGRIDKFCDLSENPDIAPGSLMSRSLSFEAVSAWQQRLPRRVAARHPATVEQRPVTRPTRSLRVVELSEWVPGAYRVRLVERPAPRGHSPMTPLPTLRSGVRGADTFDATRERRGGPDDRLPPRADLLTYGVDVFPDGDVDIWFEPQGSPGGPEGEGEFRAAVDSDGDPATGGRPSTIPGDPMPGWSGLDGIELVSRIRMRGGVMTGEAWRWDAVRQAWGEVLPPPAVEVAADVAPACTDGTGRSEDGSRCLGDVGPNPRTGILSLEPGVVELSDRFGMAGELVSLANDGSEILDSLPPDPAASETISMNLTDADYPVCAVNRDAVFPGRADAGGRATLEVYGFGEDGPVSIWLGDREQPIATGDYWEICDDPWPWVAEIELPADTPPGLTMLQVVFEGTGLTADCPISVGDAALPVLAD